MSLPTVDALKKIENKFFSFGNLAHIVGQFNIKLPDYQQKSTKFKLFAL